MSDQDAQIQLDADLVRKMSAIDPSLMDSLLALFHDEAPKRLEALRLALAVNDARAALEAAHSLKGAALQIGFSALSAIALETEQAARDGDMGSVAAAAGRLQRLYERFRSA